MIGLDDSKLGITRVKLQLGRRRQFEGTSANLLLRLIALYRKALIHGKNYYRTSYIVQLSNETFSFSFHFHLPCLSGFITLLGFPTIPAVISILSRISCVAMLPTYSWSMKFPLPSTSWIIFVISFCAQILSSNVNVYSHIPNRSVLR